jgi:hypothetical protein
MLEMASSEVISFREVSGGRARLFVQIGSKPTIPFLLFRCGAPPNHTAADGLFLAHSFVTGLMII